MMFSIIIITHRRKNLLERCLASLKNAKSDLPYELILIVNGEDISTTTFLQQEKIVFHQQDFITPGAARNFAIKKAHGEWLCFLDDDVEIPINYFQLAHEQIVKYPAMDAFGGPDQAPINSSKANLALAIALKSPLTTANTRIRHQINGCENIACEKKLILCNLWIRKHIFHEANLAFDERFFRNEENVLISQMTNYTIMHFPDLFVYHHRNANLSAIIWATLTSGRMRLKSFILFPQTINLLFFVPALFILYLILLPFLGYFPLVAYCIITMAFAIFLAISHNRINLTLRIWINHLVLNLSYGVGFWIELIFEIKRKLSKLLSTNLL